MSRLMSFGVLVAILVVIGVIFYQVMASFILPLFLATLLVVIFQPFHRWMLERCRGQAYVAALGTTLTVLLIVLAPSISVVTFAIIEASSVATQINVETLRDRLDNSKTNLGLVIPQAGDWRQIETSLTSALLGDLENIGDKTRSGPTPVAANVLPHFDSLLAKLTLERIPFNEAKSQLVRAALQKIPDDEPGTIDYDGSVQVALSEFREFKQEVLGGPLAASVKELANPSDAELRRTMLSGLKMSQDWLVSIAGDTTAFLAKLIVGILIMTVSMFFFFADGPKMIEHVMRLTPLEKTYERELLNEFDRVSRAVVVATLLSAVVQGCLAGIGYFFAGLESVFLLMMLTTVLAMVPMVGTSLIWIPASLWLF
ncbi:MAG TPA: AI-2E family transporter, partial [Pirellulaceae bacterium]|nr:AI-2E family transporter [Pirellulaceae bacterium]